MSSDALRLLLRGCKAPRSRPSSGATPTPAVLSNTSSLPRALDFFNESSNTAQAASTTTDEAPTATEDIDNSVPPEHTLSHIVKHSRLETSLRKIKVSIPTEIQRRAIPQIIAGRDVIGVAPTGSGKTLAYLIPLVRDILINGGAKERASPVGIILAPTRELAGQIGRVLGRLVEGLGVRMRVLNSKGVAVGMKGGGGGIVDIVVATPMRVWGIVEEKGGLGLGRVRYVVLDEADELLDERFLGQVDGVLGKVGSELKGKSLICLFSATFGGRVEEIGMGIVKEGKKIVVGGGEMGGEVAVGAGFKGLVDQKFVFVGGRGEQGKVMAVRGMLKGGELKPPVLVFVQTQDRAKELFRELVYEGICVDAIYGGRSQAGRDRAVKGFREGKVWILIATDVMARGLDFLGVNCVVNYDVPSSAKGYVHRAGRTGRNGRGGKVVTLFTEDDKEVLQGVGHVARIMGGDLPDFVGNKGIRKDVVKRLERRPPQRKRVGGPNRESLGKRKRERKSKSKSKSKEESGRIEKGGDAREVVIQNAKRKRQKTDSPSKLGGDD